MAQKTLVQPSPASASISGVAYWEVYSHKTVVHFLNGTVRSIYIDRDAALKLGAFDIADKARG